MTDRAAVTDDQYRTAKALAREVAETFGDRRDDPDDNWARQHIGDWADTLFLVCRQDLDGDDIVGITDLLELLAAWGPCG